MATQLSGSVGMSGKNKPDDVRAVQGLLNAVPNSLGGPNEPLAVDGFIGPKTVQAITRFQSKNFGWGDGRVDPTGKTLSQLNNYADSLGDPNSPLAAMMSAGGGTQSSGGPAFGGGTVDNAHIVEAWTVTTVVGTALIAGKPIPGNTLLSNCNGLMLWTLKNSTATLVNFKTKKIVFVPPSSLLIVGQSAAKPLASVKWTTGKGPAPYYQVGKTNPATKPAPYTSKNQGVSPGYFNQ